jgi:ribosomal-protein-alanine N-acetyltransferase
LIVGAKTAWGMGYGTEALRLVTRYAFDDLGLNKLYAGMYAENVGSVRAFLKAGYREIGILKKHVFYDGHFVDSVMVERCRDN